MARVTCAVAPGTDGYELTATVTFDDPPAARQVAVVESSQPGLWIGAVESDTEGRTVVARAPIAGTDGAGTMVGRQDLRLTVLDDTRAVDIRGLPAARRAEGPVAVRRGASLRKVLAPLRVDADVSGHLLRRTRLAAAKHCPRHERRRSRRRSARRDASPSRAAISIAWRLGLGDSRRDGDDAAALAVRRQHHAVGLVAGHAEDGAEHADDELARRVVVVQQDDLVDLRPLRPGLGFRCAAGW